MLKLFNTKLFIECENSDGFTGFDHSHDGYWSNIANVGPKSKEQCANTCTQECWAFTTYTTRQCYHLNRAQLDSAILQIATNGGKSYVKCPGSNK